VSAVAPDAAAAARRSILLHGAAAAVVLVTTGLVSARVGVWVDDLMLARIARDSAVAALLRLELGPFPLHLLLWKAAVALHPAEPSRVIHWVVAALHAANVLLVFDVLRRRLRVEQRVALVATAAFALGRPASEALLWAAADADVAVLSFALLALRSWLIALEAVRAPWRAVGWCLLAAAAKVSGALLPVALVAAALGHPRLDARRVIAPVLVVGALGALAIANALLRPGAFVYTPESHAMTPGAIAATLGAGLFRSLLWIHPERLVPGPLLGGLALAAAAAAALRGEGRVRLGLLWFALFLAPAVLASGSLQSRYLYAPSFGALLAAAAGAEALLRRAPQARAAATLAATLWLAGALALDARDARAAARCGDLNAETRALLAEHADAIAAAGGLLIVNRPPVLRPSDVLAYDTGLRVPVYATPRCPETGLPCLEYPREVRVAASCPSSAERPFARLKLAR